jgi:sugar phosphate isomerase/epimerase
LKKEKTQMTEKEQTRRQFLRVAGIGAVASLAGASSSLGQVRPAPPRGGIRDSAARRAGKPPLVAGGGKQLFKLGLASYTLRKFNLDDTLAMTKRVGLKYICFKSFHLPLDSTPAQIQAVVAKVNEAGLILYGGGVIYMTTEDQVHNAFDYAKAAGMKVIIGVPSPELLPLVDKKVEQYDIKVAIHNHGPGDKTYPTPASVYERIKDLDKRIGLCNDIGHTMRAGTEPAVSAERFADRLLDVHMKDVTEATANGQNIEIGRGVIDIPEFLKMLVKIKYSGVVSFEYEKDEDDPLAGLAESVGYVRGVLAAL